MNILLTGGHTGIGLELTKLLLKDNHQINLVAKDHGRVKAAAEALDQSGRIAYYYADLSKQEEVVRMAEEVNQKGEPIDILFNNAGVLLDDLLLSPQGNEMHYEVNTLAPIILTRSLKASLDRSKHPLVVNTVTDGIHQSRKLDIEELMHPKKFRKLFGSYMQSKLALTLAMNAWALSWPNIRVVNVIPGPNKTKMTGGKGMPAWLIPIRNVFFAPPQKGAIRLHQAAFNLQGSGIYLSKNKVKLVRQQLNDAEIKTLLSGIKTQ